MDRDWVRFWLLGFSMIAVGLVLMLLFWFVVVKMILLPVILTVIHAIKA